MMHDAWKAGDCSRHHASLGIRHSSSYRSHYQAEQRLPHRDTIAGLREIVRMGSCIDIDGDLVDAWQRMEDA